ncbi:hypothetical protein AFK68_01205 [Hydrocoleum sp. CS-953]|nr:hypothetical protein AFK68_01205 [Hydrocoleum sp. CS-953]
MWEDQGEKAHGVTRTSKLLLDKGLSTLYLGKNLPEFMRMIIIISESVDEASLIDTPLIIGLFLR